MGTSVNLGPGDLSGVALPEELRLALGVEQDEALQNNRHNKEREREREKEVQGQCFLFFVFIVLFSLETGNREKEGFPLEGLRKGQKGVFTLLSVRM